MEAVYKGKTIMITVSIYDLISWLITVISVMLFIFERKRNSRLPYYMAVQGLLRACKQKAGFYGALGSDLRRHSKNPPSQNEKYLLMVVEAAYSDFSTLMEHIMGSLKAIEPEKDMPFDTMDFMSSKNNVETNKIPNKAMNSE